MQAKKIDKKIWVIRLEKGEKIISTLKKFCLENKIQGGFFYGLGAVDVVEIAHYSFEKKIYFNQKIDKELEILNLTGNIATEKELIIHAHITVADESFHAFSGHLNEGKVNPTMEIFLFELPILKKKLDPTTGLKLLDLQ